MASVVFSADIGDEKAIDMLHQCITACVTWDPWAGVEEETARLRNNGVRVGSVLETPVSSLKPEFSFAFQCWDVCTKDLKRVAQHIFSRPAFKGLRTVGLD